MQSFIILLLTCSVTMSVVALVYMAITPLLSKRYSAKGRYYTWLIVLIGLLIPFRPQSNNALITVDVPIQGALSNNQIKTGMPFIEPAALEAISPMSLGFSIWQMIMIVWVAGMIISLGYHAIKHYRFIKFARRWSEGITNKTVISVLENLQAEMGISKKITVKQCESVGSPMMIGFVRPTILLPKIDFVADDLCFILAHELVHYKRKDLWYKMLTLLVTVIHWFNPVVYLVAKAIDIQCELSCDREVIGNKGAKTRRHYIETIIGVVKYQSKLKTVLSTNFYGGRNSMKKRIFSIMDMKKKRTGFTLICGALVLTLGTGFAFATNAAAESLSDNTPVTYTAIEGSAETSSAAITEPLPEYEQFGISYDANGKMLLNNQLVRYFWDGYEIEPGMGVTHYDYLNEAGTVDVYTVRSVIDNGDGSVDRFGELQNIVAYSQQEFDARSIDLLTGNGRGPVATTVDGGASSDSNGKTFEEIFSAYTDYGVEFVASTTGGIGNIYYQGQLVKTFYDETNDGSIFMLSSVDGGDIVVHTVYDNNGNLTGVTLIQVYM